MSERMICNVCGKPRMTYVKKGEPDLWMIPMVVAIALLFITMLTQCLWLLFIMFAVVIATAAGKSYYSEYPSTHCTSRPELGEWCPEASKKLDVNDFQEYARKVIATRMSLEDHYKKEIKVE